MADNARKKEKQRLKRKQKQLALRKAQSVSPLVKIGRTGGTLECWVNEGWEQMGMADVLVLGHAGGGNYASGVFLIDTWCVGLKDAWGRVNVSRQDFEERLLGKARETVQIVKLDVDKARQLLAGAIRFSRRNGFKLPPHYERWTAIFGNLGDIGSADISGFGLNGKLRYVGTIDFLRQRLIGSSVEQFMSRKDVEFIAGLGSGGPRSTMPFEFGELDDDDFALADDEEDQLEEDDMSRESKPALAPPASKLDAEMERMAADIVNQTEVWCKAKGISPHPFLNMAAKALVISTCAAGGAPESTQLMEGVKQNLAQILATLDEQSQIYLLAALKQIKDSQGNREWARRIEGSSTGAKAPVA